MPLSIGASLAQRKGERLRIIEAHSGDVLGAVVFAVCLDGSGEVWLHIAAQHEGYARALLLEESGEVWLHIAAQHEG